MPLRAEYVQSAGGYYFFGLFFDHGLCAAESFGKLFLGRLIRIDLLPFEVFTSEEIRVTPEQYVGAAARHVGSDRDRSLAASLSDDLGFARGIWR